MFSELQTKLNSKNASMAVVGLGYVGLPLAVEFAKQFDVIGYDISEEKIGLLRQGIDPTNELENGALAEVEVAFASDPEALARASVYIVTVPTPIDQTNAPDLSLVEAACELVGSYLSTGDVVVFESKVYPGVTEEICVPILETASSLSYQTGFHVGYSPERISPGDAKRTLTKIVKIVAGSCSDTCDFLAELYGRIVTEGIHKASSLKVGEAAKVLENTQRDLNVALMNELSIICHKLDIDTLDVIEAASTKWNFMKMTPGLVGGHCIGVDPYYLTYKAESVGYRPEVILAGRRINDNMGQYVAQQTIKQLVNAECPIKGARVLVMGITFKENVNDVRNSKIVDVISELQDYGVDVLVSDPHAKADDVQHEYGLDLVALEDVSDVDAIILSTNHTVYEAYTLSDLLAKVSRESKVFIDIKGVYKSAANDVAVSYWSL